MKISDKNLLIEEIKKIPKIANRNNWVLSLDRDEDAMFYSKSVIPKGSELFQITDDFAIYLDKKKNVQGVMLEYFDNNFVEHHKVFRPLVDKVFKKDKEIVEINPQKTKNNDVKLFEKLFETTLISEACGAELC